MDRKLIKVNYSDLTIPEYAHRYYRLYHQAKPLLKYDDSVIPFSQSEIPFAYHSKRDDKYYMFRNFVHLLELNFEAAHKREFEVILCAKPKCIETEIENYFLCLMQLNRASNYSPAMLVKTFQLCLPKLKRSSKSLRYSRRSIASISNLSENVIRAVIKEINGD